MKPIPKRVVVIGGGYAGTAAAKALDAVAEVTLIDRKDAFFHRVAALRAAVDPAWTRAPFLSYDRVLANGRFRQATVTDVDADQGLVSLESGEMVPFDAAIVATGSEAREPARFVGTSSDDAAGALSEHQRRIAEAPSVVIVGGGPVGVELAGEIKAVHPRKPITLVEGSGTLLPGDHTPKLGERARAELQRQDVTVRLGQPFDANAPENGLVLWAVGTKPTTDWLAEEHGKRLTDRGHVRVDSQLRVDGLDNVFAIGDATDADPAKLILPAVAQAKVAARNVRSLLVGREPSIAYRPSAMKVMLVPVGPRQGVSLLQGITAGSAVTRKLKGQHLFVDKYRKELGLR